MSRKNDKISPFGKEILQGIEMQGVTKTELCRKMNISRSTLYSWLYGNTAPDRNEIKLLYGILNVKSGQSQQPSFRDEIFEGDYIGMHKRVWTQHELTMEMHRGIIKDLVRKLTQTGGG